jgi:hypothetical protein
MTQAEIDSMVSLGMTDAAAALPVNDANDTVHFFALKKLRDASVNGLSFEKFKQMKQEGKFDANFNMFSNEKLEAFLQ